MWEIGVVLLLVLLNGYFSMSELAVVSARRGRLQQLADQGVRGARTAIALAEDPGKFLSTVQIGITLVGVLTGAFGGAAIAGYIAVWLRRIPVLEGYADGLALGLVVVAITYVSLIVGELVPKRLALLAPDRIAVRVARPMRLISRIGAPVVWLLQRSTEGVLTLFGVDRQKASTVSEDEVRMMIAEGASTGVFHQVERQMIERLLRLADRSVQAIMTPRFEVVWLDISDDWDVVRREIAASQHSRLPVCRGEIDEVVGVLQTKDLVDVNLQVRSLDLPTMLRQPLIVHESTTLLRLLEMFREAAVHMAIIIDEYGSLVGIATPMDILSGIAGDLPELGNQELPEALQREDGSWLIDGMLDIERVETLLAQRDMRGEHDFNTLAGFILWRLGRLPNTGDAIEWNGLRFEVVDMDGRRVDKIMVQKALASTGEGEVPPPGGGAGEAIS